MKKLIATAMATMMVATMVTGCGGLSTSTEDNDTEETVVEESIVDEEDVSEDAETSDEIVGRDEEIIDEHAIPDVHDDHVDRDVDHDNGHVDGHIDGDTVHDVAPDEADHYISETAAVSVREDA